jgi:hypothetical protein
VAIDLLVRLSAALTSLILASFHPANSNNLEKNMLKIVLGVIAGFVAWTLLWLGSDEVLTLASPGWYGIHQDDANLALQNHEAFQANTTIMLIRLAVAAVATIMSGFLAAFIAGENRRAPVALGVLLLIVGIGVQVSAWNVMPIWFHILFLALLIPLSILGGKLKTASA